MGDAACWLARVCAGCDRVADDLDDQWRCADCATAAADVGEADGDP
jgi:hypothetical protein